MPIMRPHFTVLRSTLFCALLLIPAIARSQDQQAVPEIETVGSGERRVAPDRAVAHIQLESKATSAAAAANLNSRMLQRVRDTLKTLGFDNAVSTASYNVSPDYEQQQRNTPVRSGYVARTVLRVELTKLTEIGQVIDAALAKGATGVEGILFESTAILEARRGALADAAGAARSDAEALAKAMGGTLGPLLSTSTAGASDPRRAKYGLRLSAGYGGVMGGGVTTSPTQITPNEIVVTAGVVARWRFIPGR